MRTKDYRSISSICLRASLATATITLVLAALFLIGTLYQEARQGVDNETRRLESIAPQIVRTISGELLIGDNRAAIALMRELQQQYHLSELKLESGDVKCEASSRAFFKPQQACLVSEIPGKRFANEYVVMRSHTSISGISGIIFQFLWIAVPMFAFGIISAFQIRRELQRSIVHPIGKLVTDPEGWSADGKWVAKEAVTLHQRLLSYIKERDQKSVEAEALKIEASVGKMASQVAHDIRSPLAALELVAANVSELPEDMRMIVRRGVSRIRDIANVLLDKNKSSQDCSAKTLDSNTCDASSKNLAAHLLSSLVEPILTEKRIQHATKVGVEIESVMGKESYGLFANIDPIEFKRMISNLVDNAVEAMPVENGRVTVSLSSKEEKVLLQIKDNGKGIPVEILPRLMRRRQTFGKKGGSGLGLYQTRMAAESWGGHVAIESQPDQGTTVTVSIPQAVPPAWFVPFLTISTRTKVVILDDDRAIHSIWENRLQQLGKPISIFHFTQAQEFSAWVERESKGQPVLYLIDYELIGQSCTGLDLIEKLEIGNDAILITSRYEEIEIRCRCEKLGVCLIPKGLAGFVPITLVDSTRNVDYVLIDDDSLIRDSWKTMANILGKSVAVLSSEEGLDRLDLSHDTPVYVDKNLNHGVSGIDVLKRLKDRGYQNLYLTTGEKIDRSEMPLPFLRGVIGKEFPVSTQEMNS